MSTHPPVAGKNSKAPAAKPGLVPPEEQFWHRYSPHQEAPLSGVGSLTLHVLGFGFLFLAALIIAKLAGENPASLPVEGVSIQGGGGGKVEGTSKDPGTALNKEDTPANPDAPPPTPDVARTELPKDAVKDKSGVDFPKEEEAVRPLNSAADRLAALSEKARERLVLRDPPKAAPAGGGGTGSGGGTGAGVGTGTGAGVGPGKGTMNQRTARMLRWTMTFDTRSGHDYLNQLRGLGAILAIPKDGADGEYLVIRDLTPGRAKPAEEDVRKINRIFWIDSTPRSVVQIMQALGLNRHPSHFVAFMPEKLEQKLFELERDYRGLKEEQIFETKFRVNHTGRGYEPEVISQQPK